MSEENRETWHVRVTMDNEPGIYYHARDLARLAIQNRDEGVAEVPEEFRDSAMRSAFADELRDWYTEMAPDLGGTVWGSLLTTALGNVDWFGLARDLLDEVYADADL